METLLAIAFLIFALGFFTWTLGNAQSNNDRVYERRVEEIREFGYEKTRRPTILGILETLIRKQ